MKKSFFLLLLLIFGSITAQSYHFYYEVSFKPDSLSTEMKKETMILDISKEEVKFYPYTVYLTDSLTKHNKTPDKMSSNLNIRLKRKVGSNENFNYHTPSTTYYYLVKTTDTQDWKLSPEKKMIGEFSVQKATTEFGGRQWEAWFCPDLPFPQGPYKFQGLPGLILEIKDTKGDYRFSFAKNINLPQTYDTTYIIEKLSPWVKSSPIEISEKRWEKLQLEYFSNPLKDLDTNTNMFKNSNNEKMDIKEVSKILQKRMLKRNNPIELNKAVKLVLK